MSNFATKNDLKNFATKNDLKNFATHFDSKFEQITDELKILGSRLINQGEVIHKINKKIDSLEKSQKMFETKLDVLYSERQENSIYVEKDINNYVSTYLQDKYPNGQIINLKEKMVIPSQEMYQLLNDQYPIIIKTTKNEKILPLLNITDKTSLLLYHPDMKIDQTNNPISELDGLYLVNYRTHCMVNGKLAMINVSELFIVEAKLSFTVDHLQQKLDKFNKIKELLIAPRSHFTMKEYSRFISKYLRNIDRISIFYGSPDWQFDLKNYSVVNNNLKLSDSGTLSLSVQYSEILKTCSSHLINNMDQFYNDGVVYPLLERPDLHFLKKAGGSYVGYDEVDSLLGGSTDDSTHFDFDFIEN